MATTTIPTARTRTPRGVPTGGQFAPENKDEPGALLSPAQPSDRLVTDDNARRILDKATRMVSQYSDSRQVTNSGNMSGYDVDDAAQDTIVALLERGEVAGTINNRDGYMNNIAKNIVSKSRRDGDNQSAIKARRMFHARTGLLEQQLGRKLTRQEKDDVAAQVRDSWPAGRKDRPAKDFHRTVQRTRVQARASDVAGEETGFEALLSRLPRAEAASGLSGVDDETAEPAEGSKAHALLSTIDDHDGSGNDIPGLKASAFNAVAEMRGAPQVKPGSLSKNAAVKARKTMKATSGGVRSAIRDWENGVDNHATRALLSPFGDNLTAVEEQQVIDVYTVSSGTPEQMWELAVSAADVRSKRAV